MKETWIYEISEKELKEKLHVALWQYESILKTREKEGFEELKTDLCFARPFPDKLFKVSLSIENLTK